LTTGVNFVLMIDLENASREELLKLNSQGRDLYHCGWNLLSPQDLTP
jgi:hypothetical protein